MTKNTCVQFFKFCARGKKERKKKLFSKLKKKKNSIFLKYNSKSCINNSFLYSYVNRIQIYTNHATFFRWKLYLQECHYTNEIMFKRKYSYDARWNIYLCTYFFFYFTWEVVWAFWKCFVDILSQLIIVKLCC